MQHVEPIPGNRLSDSMQALLAYILRATLRTPLTH